MRQLINKQNIICETVGVGKILSITLNRPKQLNSVNLDIMKDVQESLKQYQSQVYILRGANGNLSAGGDIKSIYTTKNTVDIFYEGYTVANKVASLPNLVAFFEGINIGGVVGWTQNSQFRIATEKTILAVPELRIGLFVDCAGSHWIHRRKGRIGEFLAYTGYRLRGADLVHSGMADYFVPSDKIQDLYDSILYNMLNINSNTDLTNDTVGKLNWLCEKVAIKKQKLPQYNLDRQKELIEECFSQENIHDYYEFLKRKNDKFSKELLDLLNVQSPLSLRVEREYLKRSKSFGFNTISQYDFHLSQKFMKQGIDFFEGVKSVLVDKTHKPQWQYSSYDQIDQKEVDDYFDDFEPKLRLD